MTRAIPKDEQVSRNMRAVRRSHTGAETSVAKILRDLGVAYRLHVRGLPGTPDFVNRRRGFAIFVNGCFWHRHRGCRRATVPKNNRAFWIEKFAANRRRDAVAIRGLRRMGLKVVLVWECELEKPETLRLRLQKSLKR